MAALASNLEALDPTPFVRQTEHGEEALELLITGAHCANCIARIESRLKRFSGVTAARLNLSTGKLSVRWHNGAVKPRDIAQSVQEMGFKVRPFSADAAVDAGESEGRFLLKSLAVAGFGTAFVTGLTDMIYFGGDLPTSLREQFNWIAAAIAVPVTLYAGQPFFRSALTALKSRRGNMDIPISLSLLLTLALSLYQTLIGSQYVYFDAAVMLCLILLSGRYLDARLRHRARGAASDLLSMQATTVRRINALGNLELVAASALQPGDEIVLSTGERTPVDGKLLSETEADISLVTGESNHVTLHAGQELYAGSVVTGAAANLSVCASAGNSLIADLVRLLEAGQQARGRHVRLSDRAARLYVPLVHGLALAVFSAWIAVSTFETAITNAITVLIVTCPCALGLAVPAVQIVATSRLFRKGLLIKSGDALERLSDINRVVFDKTGTLTLGVPHLTSPHDATLLERAAQLARTSRHPLARALSQAAGSGPTAQNTVEVSGHGIETRTETRRRLGRADWVGAPASDDGMTELWYCEGDAAPVRFTFTDQLRPDARETVAALAERGIATTMLTGDRPATAAAIAATCGIADWQAETEPRAKVRFIQALRSKGNRTLMIGDGLNDAAALAAAHVSIAPASGVDATQMAADMVLGVKNLAPIVDAIDTARRARRLVLQNLGFAAAYNAIAIPLAALGYVTPLLASIAMASSSLIVTLNALRAYSGSKHT